MYLEGSRYRLSRLPVHARSLRGTEGVEASGAALAPGFAAFAEACLVKGVTLHVLSRGWKPVISHFLRSAGLGHVQVRERQ